MIVWAIRWAIIRLGGVPADAIPVFEQQAYEAGLEHGVEAACAFADEAYQRTRVGFTADL